MHDLLKHPLCRESDLGAPIPDSPHAVSVCLPTWRDNIGYEEQEPRVIEKVTTGYPRFVYNRLCRELFALCEERFAREGERCVAFPSLGSAERFCRFLKDHAGAHGRISEFGQHDVQAVCFGEQFAEVAKSAWQHCGEGVSSRQAAACLHGTPAVDGTAAETEIRARIARLTAASAQDVFLYPCGMAAVFAVYRALQKLLPGRKTVQWGFPYVDTLKIQQKFGPVRFFPGAGADELRELETLLDSEPISGLYTEFPTNPLLMTPDVGRLAELARQHDFPLVVDDTIAGFANVAVLPAADVLCSSLTKFFSGAGDVTGGSVVLNSRSPFYAELACALRASAEDLFWGADAITLERNSRDYEQRVPQINQHAVVLADRLHADPRVRDVYFPKFCSRSHYDAFRRPGAGYSGLLSIVLADPAVQTARFFDALEVCKGPNLGTNYTLACPFTILAHYRELEFAESCGVSRYLIRVSVGLEDPADLVERFERALGRLD